jgi:transcription termination/antitermination protein NusG
VQIATMTDDDSPFVADDAVSNRSDDTALDEGDSAHTNGREPLEGEQLAGAETGSQNAPHATERSAEQQETHERQDSVEEASVEDEATDVESEIAEEPVVAPKGPIEETPEEPEDIHMDWFILKVQSNRERSIAEALERKMKIEGYERFFDQAIVPTEKVTEFKAGKKKVVERKLYPGYIVVHMHINDDTWFAVRETSGVGDFTGAGGKPTPMLPHEVSRIIQTEEEETSEAPKLDIKFAAGDKVKVKEGNFESFEGEVNTIDEASGRVTVMINIFGRSTPVELEYWQIEAV